MARLAIPAALLLAIGCTPQDATVEGTYTAWLAESSSATAYKADTRELMEAATHTFDCSRLQPIDAPSVGTDFCEDLELDWASWLESDGYHVFKGSIEPWRSEAIITSEGNLQLTVHVALPAGQDFRMAWVVNPDFHPKSCQQVGDGEVELLEEDGADWVEKWSETEDGAHIFYLNAGALQYNPYDSDEYWVLPERWLSGFAHARFAEDEFISSPSVFGETPAAQWYFQMDSEDPDMEGYEEYVGSVKETVEAWQAELSEGILDDVGVGAPMQLKVEGNEWRPVDAATAGLDGWVQMDSSWVRLDQRGPIEPGDTVAGDFHIFFTALDSASQLHVEGTFEIPSVREDKWGYPVLDDEKRLENETPECE